MSRRSDEEKSRLVFPPGVIPPPTSKARKRAEGALGEASQANVVQGVPASAAIRNMTQRILDGVIVQLTPFLEEHLGAIHKRLDALEEKVAELRQ